MLIRDVNLEIFSVDDCFNSEGKLEFTLSNQNDYIEGYLSRSESTQLRDHLNKVLGPKPTDQDGINAMTKQVKEYLTNDMNKRIKEALTVKDAVMEYKYFVSFIGLSKTLGSGHGRVFWKCESLMTEEIIKEIEEYLKDKYRVDAIAVFNYQLID